jgi:hypothetical protein
MDETDFAWLNWRQAKAPLSEELRQVVASFDCDDDIRRIYQALGGAIGTGSNEELVDAGILPSPEHLLTLRIGTLLLQHGVKAGLTIYDIGCMMTRMDPDKLCPLEEMIGEAVRRRQCAMQNEDTDASTIEADVLRDHRAFMRELEPLVDKAIEQCLTEKANEGKK